MPSRAAQISAAALAVFSLGAFAFYAIALLLKEPPVWPDEGIFGNAAVNLAYRGVLATDLLAGALPGIERHTYWMPPLYFLPLAALFGIFGVSVVVIRAYTLAAAAAVLALTYGIARRLGMKGLAACVPMSILAVDALFHRGARLGRMDMLALALILGAAYLALGASTWRHYLLAGVTAGLALLTHPVGASAPAAISLALVLFPSAPRRKALPLFLAGVALAVLPWVVYILQDLPSFLAQFQLQMQRKASRGPVDIGGVRAGLNFFLAMYGPSVTGPAKLAWILGTVGLGALAWRARGGRLLLVVQMVIAVVVLWSREMWYPLYLLPILALGAGALIGSVEQAAWRRVAGAAAGLALAWFAFSSLRAEEEARRNHAALPEGADYAAFCRRLSEALPAQATVLLSSIPDPYLGLASRTDLTFRQFVPEQMPLDPTAHARFLEAADYIVVGRRSPSQVVSRFARARGSLAAEIAFPGGYQASVFRMR